METELLIALVQKRPLLWDTSCELYKDKNKKSDAWVEVCCGLFEDFSLRSESDKKNTVNEIITKWRTVRDNYIRSLKKLNKSQKSGSAGKQPTKYVYHEQLMFLDKLKNERTTESSLDSTSPQVATESDVTEVEINEAPNIAKTVCEPPAKKKFCKKTNVSGSNVETKLMSFIESYEKHNFNKPNEPEDEDLHLFKSLLPNVKLLNPMTKMDFRIEVMKLLKTLANRDNEDSRNTTSRSSSAGTYFSEFNLEETPSDYELYKL